MLGVTPCGCREQQYSATTSTKKHQKANDVECAYPHAVSIFTSFC